MKQILLLFAAMCLFSCAQNSVTINSENIVSMCVTGKGPGQDAAINPYAGEASVAIVKNIGDTPFQIRHTNNNQEIIELLPIGPGEKINVQLGATDHMYFDSESPYDTKVAFKRQ
ncbi:MAG: hypothetical protein KTR13_05595 [Saprospiraceae bacterium]|nr:hypothetical protein [Saprospiraceae bacterium]